MTSAAPYSVGSTIVLRRINGGWQVFSAYAPGEAGPMGFDLRRKNDLAAVYSYIGQFHSDEPAQGGVAATKTDDPVRPIEPGDLVVIERRHGGWVMNVDGPMGGISLRAAPFPTIAQVIEHLRMHYGAE